jgi:phospholipase C
MFRRAIAMLAASACIAACSGSLTNPRAGGIVPPVASAAARTPIAHVIVLVQENRSFDDFFATFPGADGTTVGKTWGGRKIALRATTLRQRCDFGHSYGAFLRAYDGGKMDGFWSEGATGRCGNKSTAPYRYVKPQQVVPYWTIAQRYVLADHLFQTQAGGSFTAHQDLIAGGTMLDPTTSLIDLPSHAPWGCDAPGGTVTSLLKYVDSKLVLEYHKGPFPCLDYPTLRDSLDAKSISWKYYSPPVVGGPGAIWNGFDAIQAVRYGPEWNSNVTKSEKVIFSDITHHRLPAVSWLIASKVNSDHPMSESDTGPSWVASVVNAIGESSYWKSTAIVVVWDDWGGFYDHVPPPFFDHWGGLGFRVPMLIVSAYARRGSLQQGGYVSHTRYEFGSILKFIEDTFGLPRLKRTDVRANSIAGCFDFSQPPLSFKRIQAKYSQTYFVDQRSTNDPVDTE